MRRNKGKSEMQMAREAEVARAYVERREPDPRAWGGEPRSTQPPAVATPAGGPPPDDIFTGADLTSDLLGEGREYPIRIKGRMKKLYIFPCTPDDVKVMLAWSMRTDRAGAEPKDPMQAYTFQSELEANLRASQVILCTRQGPNRQDRRCFGMEHRPALNTLMGNSTILEIVQISNEMSGNDESLGGSARRFFGVIRACLQTWPSVSVGSEDSLAGWQIIQTRLLSLVTRAHLHGSLDAGLMDDLGDLEALLNGSR